MRRTIISIVIHKVQSTALLAGVFLTLSSSVLSQNIQVRGGFLTDSVKIGGETAFYLAASYPENLNILFPDSAYDFAPFEYQTKKYQATRTRDGHSYDSVVYFLTTFEVDYTQFLSMEIFVVNEQDCTAYASNTDSLMLIEMVKTMPDSVSIENLPLMTATAYHPVKYQINYVVILVIAAAVIIISIILWVLYGRRIIRYFQAKKLQKKHFAFIDAYNQVLRQVQQAFSPPTTETALTLWKKYMEQLEARPYTKLTTRETLMLQHDESLGENLRNIDKAIYGSNTAVVHSLEYLKNVADERFSKKLSEVKRGK